MLLRQYRCLLLVLPFKQCSLRGLRRLLCLLLVLGVLLGLNALPLGLLLCMKLLLLLKVLSLQH